MSNNPFAVQLQQHVDDYVQRHTCRGVDGFGKERDFVPQRALTEFWTLAKITATFCHGQNTSVFHNADDIMNHYIVIFSILVLTSGVQHLELFTEEDINDTSLPLDSIPESYRESCHNEVFENFLKAQWKFCPLPFSVGLNPKPSKKKLSPEMIIPISPTAKRKINPEADEDNDTAVLYIVDFHPKSTLLTIPLVFKEYLKPGQVSQKLFDNEWAMYTQLKEDAFNHIVRYHGSFQCLDRRTIVLEYAPGGDLLSFFKNRKPPRADYQRKQFWLNIIGLLEGLAAIDDLTRYCEDDDQSREMWHLKGTHQDIRPQNILICGEPSDDDYSVPFKFADMGLAHIRKVKNHGIDRFAVDHFGNGMYSAPEAFRDDGGIKTIRHKSDVYSLGGILSEALIWMIWGEKGREAYQAERVRATREIRLRGGYHEGAFHDGDGLLHVVEEWHQRAVEITGGKAEALSQVIIKFMLAADPDRRYTAAQAFQAFATAIPTLESDNITQNYIDEGSQSETSSEPPITIDQIWKDCFEPGIRTTNNFGRKFWFNSDIDPLRVFPALEDTLSRLKGNSGRNQIFILDDSISMKPHRDQVARTCRVLIKLLKKGHVDPDKEFELYFASKGRLIKAKNGTDIQTAVEKHDFSKRRCEMRSILDQVASRVMEQRQPVSLYVLTNGHWDIRNPSSICSVEKPIERLVKHIVEKNEQANWAMVQFIGFYKDPPSEADRYGKARLKYLDNDLGLESDIVDTRNAKKDIPIQVLMRVLAARILLRIQIRWTL
ncbi:hypothetical protein GQ607_003046 [Colletotrichum asianum]|uniref:non-specific serine/threonine protein kinase n=1 Tax=Colletotrichum asianum TaxID=702518 RepID=A0A8H3ZS75_9PEZI|nr:hypothetical protein GQ607_003046 [Colletotrichum asianum]